MLILSKLATELGMAEEQLVQRCISLNIQLKSRGKRITESDAEKVRRSLQKVEEPVEEVTEEKAVKCSVALPLVIGIADLAERLETNPAEILKKLIQNGVLANINDELDFDTAGIIADEFGFEAVEEVTEMDDQLEEVVGTENRLKQLLREEDPKKMKPRPPIVTVMGHVDHGKTSLLDAIRETDVWSGEEGGITQHIGAYQVTLRPKEDDGKGKKQGLTVGSDKRIAGRTITFIDTPGHEAFTQMRARGAQVTDIAVLVVAADDGVRPQTIEALNHARAAGVPIIVAINKIDKPGADIERAKRELTENDLVPEEWGGKTIMVPVSAKKRQGLEDLLEMVLLVADLEDLKANPDRPAVGTIVEAKKTVGKGVVATVLVQAGTLQVGDPILVGSISGRVKALGNALGKKMKEARPAEPAEISGLPDVPEAGDVLQVVADDRTAQQLAKMLERRERAMRLRPTSRISLESFYASAAEGEVKHLNLILKTDVKGSAEAIKDSLKKLETDEVKVDVVHEGTGDISPSDISLAAASHAVVIGFSVRVSPAAEQVVQQTGVDVRMYRIIYKLIEDVQKAMGGLLGPEEITILRARLEVKAVFSQNRDRFTIGGYISQGVLKQRDKVKIMRGEIEVGRAEIVSLRRESTEVKEVKDGVECGLMLKKVKGEIKEGDFVDVYIIEKREREL